jgi:hypothetical protein
VLHETRGSHLAVLGPWLLEMSLQMRASLAPTSSVTSPFWGPRRSFDEDGAIGERIHTRQTMCKSLSLRMQDLCDHTTPWQPLVSIIIVLVEARPILLRTFARLHPELDVPCRIYRLAVQIRNTPCISGRTACLGHVYRRYHGAFQPEWSALRAVLKRSRRTMTVKFHPCWHLLTSQAGKGAGGVGSEVTRQVLTSLLPAAFRPDTCQTSPLHHALTLSARCVVPSSASPSRQYSTCLRAR